MLANKISVFNLWIFFKYPQVDAGLRFENRKQKYQFMFDVKTPKRTYYLVAESEADMNKWVDAVCQVCGLKAYTQDEEQQCQSEFRCRKPLVMLNEKYHIRRYFNVVFLRLLQCFHLDLKNRHRFLRPVLFPAPTFPSANVFPAAHWMTLVLWVQLTGRAWNNITMLLESWLSHHPDHQQPPTLKAFLQTTSGPRLCLVWIGIPFRHLVSNTFL